MPTPIKEEGDKRFAIANKLHPDSSAVRYEDQEIEIDNPLEGTDDRFYSCKLSHWPSAQETSY